MIKNGFDNEFYNQQWREVTASIIITEIFKILPKINSAVDFGCGLGAWLMVLKNFGITDIKGYDGNWVDKEALKIPKECFQVVDLGKSIVLERRYDFAVSIEVAEHLPEEFAKVFVETLTKASDMVLFSAAIPYQGGIGHIKEQWQSYWYDLFHDYGYVGIDIRSLIWNNNSAGFLQRQNILLYVKECKVKEIQNFEGYAKTSGQYIDFVHPEMYRRRDIEAISLFRLYKLVIKKTITTLFGEKIFKKLKKIIKQNNGT